jgi:hypothetical protein
MESTESIDDSLKQMPERGNENISDSRATSILIPQAGCSTCDGGSANINGSAKEQSFIYALGQIEARFPSLAVEKEFAQAIGRTETKGQTDRQAFHSRLLRVRWESNTSSWACQPNPRRRAHSTVPRSMAKL